MKKLWNKVVCTVLGHKKYAVADWPTKLCKTFPGIFAYVYCARCGKRWQV